MQWTAKSSKLILIAVISLAIFSWGAFRLFSFQQQLPQLLAEKLPQLSYQQSQFHIFPTPTIQLDNAIYNYKERYQLSAKKVEGEMSWYNVLTNNSLLSNVKLVDSQLQTKAHKPLFSHINANLNFSLKQSGEYYLGVEAHSPQEGNVALETDIALKPNGVSFKNLHLKAFLKQKQLFNSDNLTLFAKQGSFSEHHMVEQLQFSDVLVNKLPVSALLLHIQNNKNKNNPQFSYQRQISGKIIFPQGELLVNSEALATEGDYKYHLNGTSLPSGELLKLFAVPALLDGPLNIQGSILLQNGKLSSGNIDAVLNDAKINGINLSQLLAQYLPLTFSLQQKMAEYTKLNQLSLGFNWHNEQVIFNKIIGLNSQIRIAGDGKLNLSSMQCNFKLAINSNDSRFEQYQLPFHFFGPCHSPQYTVKFDSKIKDEIKKLIKNKLKAY